MKKTDFNVCIGKHNGYDVYRTVYVSDEHYYIKADGKIYCVDHLKDRFGFRKGV